MKIQLKNLIIAPLALMTLSACAYGGGYGQYDLGYSDDQYCDPYNEYDAYYGCDLEYGFANFGYGGGWHQDFYYPGFGFFIFDNLGRRFRMNDYYLGYWGRKRQRYFQGRFSDRRYSGYRLRSFPWSERNGKRFVRGDRVRNDRERRAERRENRRRSDRDDRLENRQARRQARREQGDTSNRQRSERREDRKERRQTRGADNSNAGTRERGRRGNARGNTQARNRANNPPPSNNNETVNNAPAPHVRLPQNRQERSRPQRARIPKARPPRVKQNRSKRPSRSNNGNRSRQPRRNFPKDD